MRRLLKKIFNKNSTTALAASTTLVAANSTASQPAPDIPTRAEIIQQTNHLLDEAEQKPKSPISLSLTPNIEGFYDTRQGRFRSFPTGDLSTARIEFNPNLALQFSTRGRQLDGDGNIGESWGFGISQLNVQYKSDGGTLKVKAGKIGLSDTSPSQQFYNIGFKRPQLFGDNPSFSQANNIADQVGIRGDARVYQDANTTITFTGTVFWLDQTFLADYYATAIDHPIGGLTDTNIPSWRAGMYGEQKLAEDTSLEYGAFVTHLTGGDNTNSQLSVSPHIAFNTRLSNDVTSRVFVEHTVFDNYFGADGTEQLTAASAYFLWDFNGNTAIKTGFALNRLWDANENLLSLESGVKFNNINILGTDLGHFEVFGAVQHGTNSGETSFGFGVRKVINLDRAIHQLTHPGLYR